METLQQIYERNKHPSSIAFGDKGTHHSYIEVYETLLAQYRDTAENVLEVGVAHGHSLRMWSEYFNGALVHGIDINPECRKVTSPGIIVHICDSTDPIAVNEHIGDNKFDVIVDDGKHNIRTNLDTFHNLFPKLKEDGIYVIEDIPNVDKNGKVYMKFADNVEIIDRRKIKNNSRDVLVVIRRGKHGGNTDN